MEDTRNGITKDVYFQMCEAMGNQPKEDEIPLGIEELPNQLQRAFSMYGQLQDVWDFMGGNYIGKNLSDFTQVADLYDVPKEDRLLYLDFIRKIDDNRSKAIAAKKPKK